LQTFVVDRSYVVFNFSISSQTELRNVEELSETVAKVTKLGEFEMEAALKAVKRLPSGTRLRLRDCVRSALLEAGRPVHSVQLQGMISGKKRDLNLPEDFKFSPQVRIFIRSVRIIRLLLTILLGFIAAVEFHLCRICLCFACCTQPLS
jgi:hypothetical protein